MERWPLPIEITLDILQYLTYHDVWSLSRSSRVVYAAAKSTFLLDTVRLGSSTFSERLSAATYHDRFQPKQKATKSSKQPRPYRVSNANLESDAEFIKAAGFGDIIREAYITLESNPHPLRQILQQTPNIRTVHIFGGMDPNGALVSSAAIKDLRTLCPNIHTLEMTWRWKSDGMILDASSEGPSNLKRLKMDLSIQAYKSRTPPPVGMLPRMVKRAASGSLSTLTELDLRLFLSYKSPAVQCDVDLAALKGAPLRVLKYTVRSVNNEAGSLRVICDSFPDLEELMLYECWRPPPWKDSYVTHLSNLRKCKLLTLPFEFQHLIISSFASYPDADAFGRLLPRVGSVEHEARSLTLRTPPTCLLITAMQRLERITWVEDYDHVAREGAINNIKNTPSANTSREGASTLRQDWYTRAVWSGIGPRSYSADVVGAERAVCWQREPWWATVVTEKIGPDHGGVECQKIWMMVN